MDTSPAAQAPSMVGMDKPRSNSTPTVILWITFVLSAGVLIYLLVASRSLANLVAERQSTQDDLAATLSSSDYSGVEAQATSFKTAFSALSSLVSSRKPKSEVLSQLYQYFTKDVTIRNLAISQDGSLTLDGSTASYRAVADFMTGLKSYSKISDLKLGSTAVSTEEGVAANEKVTFSITAKLDMAKEQVVVSDTTDSSATSDSSGTDSSESVTPAEAE